MGCKRFTASYIYTDSNFEINNIPEIEKRDEFYSLYCLLINLLQRGCPTKASLYLSKDIKVETRENKIHLFSKEVPDWGTTIKGYDQTNAFPARTFYYSTISEKFPEYPFLKQIMIPEMLISEFIFDGNEDFINQKVDFFISEASLVIEIDGSQHAGKTQKILDEKRDEYIRANGFSVIRIPSDCINDDYRLNLYISEVKKILEDYQDIFAEYKRDYELCLNDQLSKDALKAVATMRFQIAILQLCINGQLSLSDKEWKIAINNKEVTGYEITAVEDVLLWLKNLSILAGIEYNAPTLDIQQTTQLGSFLPEYIKLEFSIASRRTSASNTVQDRIYVSNCWRQDVDYFQMTTAKPIKYIIDDSGIDKKNSFSGTELNEKRVALRFLLKNLYGFDEFRPGQERIIINALKRRDTIGVLPTGSGKSLCYQMAALLQPCISYCICPIKSLMIDQDQNLKAVGVDHTAYISSDLTTEERALTQKNFAQKKYWWVFMSPERFQSETFRDFLLDMGRRQKIDFGYAVIDEVHCLSEWGHSFRVSYLNLLKTIRRYCPDISLLGLTATASFNVLKNILVEFGMTDKRDVISIPSFTRPELNFRVVKCKEDKYVELKKIIDGYRRFFPDLLMSKCHETRCGIVFTPYINGKFGCYPLSNDLGHSYKADVRCFGGDMPKKWPGDRNWDIYKREVQDDFKDNNFALLCATKAFGMGIDKPNVRYTVHYGIPSSLESLYQEAGRAGRDKNKAECAILYTSEDELKDKISYLLSIGAKPSEIREFAQQKSNLNNGEDAYRQIYLLSNELSDVEEELKILDELVDRYANSGRLSYIKATYPLTLKNLQKYIYHLSLIGVVEDWTVDWGSDTLKVYFSEYTPKSVFKAAKNYIKYYDVEYKLTDDPLYKKKENWNSKAAIHQAAEIFLTWYANNILYTRRQALLNVMDACDEYTEKTKDEFKEKMEAYFRLDDISDMLGTIADQPREVREWFEVLNIDSIKRSKISNILMNLNRFLESYQNNVGLNFISGILNLLDQHFDSPNGRTRLLAAFTTIKDFKNEDKQYILEQSSKLIVQLSEQDDAIKEEFSEFFIRNYEYDETDKVIYKELEDNYSLQAFMRRMMAYMVEISGGNK